MVSNLVGFFFFDDCDLFPPLGDLSGELLGLLLLLHTLINWSMILQFSSDYEVSYDMIPCSIHLGYCSHSQVSYCSWILGSGILMLWTLCTLLSLVWVNQVKTLLTSDICYRCLFLLLVLVPAVSNIFPCFLY